MKPDFFWIHGPWRGSLAIVSRPRGGDWLEDETAAWRNAGIGVMVSLLENGEAAELGLANEFEAAKASGIRLLSFPIPDRGVPSSHKDALSFLANVRGLLEEGQNVGLHCRQSVGRSGLFAAGLLVRSGMNVEKALDAVSTARGVTVPETDGQLDWIRHLPSDNLVLA